MISASARPNPLRRSLAESIDFARLATAPIKLFITATNVRTGRPRVFRNAELSPEVLLASACLPTMFQAVEIDGEAYWDGGYSGNPTMTPLVQECVSDDTILVAINPVERPGDPAFGPRHPQPPERGLVQRGAAEGTAHDRPAAPGRGRRRRRGRALGAHAHPHDQERHDGRARLLVQAQCRMGVPLHAARRGPARGRTPSWRRTARISGSAPRSTSIACWRASDDGPCRRPARPGAAGLAGLPRLERAAARAGGGAAGRGLRRRTAAGALDADLHGQRRAVPGAVLSAVPAGRAVRQADGGQRLGHGDRAAG